MAAKAPGIFIGAIARCPETGSGVFVPQKLKQFADIVFDNIIIIIEFFKGILHSYNRNFKSELDRYIYV